MQWSYKIIKNKNISYGEEGISISNIKLDPTVEEDLASYDTELEAESELEQEDEELVEEVDIEAIRAEIRQELLMQNQQERERLLEDTRQEALNMADEIKEQAKEEGYKVGLQEGYKKGIEESQAECNEMKDNAISLLNEAEQEVKEYFQDNKAEIIKLAGDMAESIVHKTIDLSHENILMLIKPIVQLYEKKENIIITCHPDNISLLKARIRHLEEVSPNSRFIILEDANLEKNGCVIENESQIIDLQIKKQVDSIIEDIGKLEV